MNDDRAPLIREIRDRQRRRWQWLRSRIALENAIRAIERSVAAVRKDKDVEAIFAADPMLRLFADQATAPLRDATALLREACQGRPAHNGSPLLIGEEGQMRRVARKLPVWDAWAAGVRGFGELGLAQIIGEAGDLSDYANPAKLWKRMGLAVLQDGTRQRNIAGVSAEQALTIGYVAKRRAVMAVIGDSLLRGNRDGEYRAYYLAEKARQAVTHPDQKAIVHHKRALRHMEKRLLRDLWREWRKADGLDPGQGWQDVAPMEAAS